MFNLILVALLSLSPYLSQNQKDNALRIVSLAILNDMDPITFLAIGYVESRFRPVQSKTGDYGIMQINCRFWYKELQYASRKSCAKDMMKPEPNIRASFKVYQKYTQQYDHCRESKFFKCYNGGPRWYRSKNRDKIQKYANKCRYVVRKLTSALSAR